MESSCNTEIFNQMTENEIQSIKVDRLLGEGAQGKRELGTSLIGGSSPYFYVTQLFSWKGHGTSILGLPYCKGGELYKMVKAGLLCNDSEIKFFAANVLVGVQQLHRRGIIYNDLKPENVIFDSEQGYCMLTDFGLARRHRSLPLDHQFGGDQSSPILEMINDDVSKYSIKLQRLTNYSQPNFGTPEYLAPEFYLNRDLESGLSIAGDYWAFGCFLYELTQGVPPFFNVDTKRLITKIVYTEPEYKGVRDPLLKDLLQLLLLKDPVKRLQSIYEISSGYEPKLKLLAHPWFLQIKWLEREGIRYLAPFKEQEIQSQINSPRQHQQQDGEYINNKDIQGQQEIVSQFKTLLLSQLYQRGTTQQKTLSSHGKLNSFLRKCIDEMDKSEIDDEADSIQDYEEEIHFDTSSHSMNHLSFTTSSTSLLQTSSNQSNNSSRFGQFAQASSSPSDESLHQLINNCSPSKTELVPASSHNNMMQACGMMDESLDVSKQLSPAKPMLKSTVDLIGMKCFLDQQ